MVSSDIGESGTSGDFIPCWAQGRYVNRPYGLVRSTCLLEDGHLGPHEFLPGEGSPARDGDTPQRGATASCGIESLHERHLWVPRNRDYPVLCTGGEFAPYFEPGLVAIDETEATRAPTRTIKAAGRDVEGPHEHSWRVEGDGEWEPFRNICEDCGEDFDGSEIEGGPSDG